MPPNCVANGFNAVSEKIPEGWEVVNLTEVFDIQGGSQPPAKTFKKDKGVSKLTNINGGTIVVDDDYREGWNRIFNKNKFKG